MKKIVLIFIMLMFFSIHCVYASPNDTDITQTTSSEIGNITDRLNSFTDNMIKTGSVTSEMKSEYDNEIILFDEKLKNDLSVSSAELQNYKKSVNRYQNNVLIYANNYKSLPAYLANYANKPVGNYSLDGMAIEVKNNSYVSIDLKDAQYTISTGDEGSYNHPYVKIKSPQGNTYFFLYNEEDADTYFLPTNKGMELNCEYDGEKTFLLNTEKRDSLVENEAIMLSDEFWNVQVPMGRLGFTYKNIKLDNDAGGTEYITLPNPQNAKVTTTGILSDENMKKAGIENYAVITVGTNSYYWNRQTHPDQNIKFDTDNSQMIIEYDRYNVYINIKGNSLIEIVPNETSTIETSTTVTETTTESTTSGTTQFTQTTTVTTVNDSPSSWAKDEITEAVNYNLLPKEFQTGYKEPITRRDFCKLTVCMLRTYNPGILNISDTDKIAFDDTDDEDVTIAASLGIVSGVGNNLFNPNNFITRQEAARMLCMAASLPQNHTECEKYFSNDYIIKNRILDYPYKFADYDKIAYWAKVDVQYCYQNNIMFGVGNDKFDPMGQYSREQSYLTVLRLFKSFQESTPENSSVKEYRSNNGKQVVFQNGIFSLTDLNKNILIKDISENLPVINEPDSSIVDCFGEYIIIKHNFTPDPYSANEYEEKTITICNLYTADGTLVYEAPLADNVHFTSDGKILTCSDIYPDNAVDEKFVLFKITDNGLSVIKDSQTGFEEN